MTRSLWHCYWLQKKQIYIRFELAGLTKNHQLKLDSDY